MDVEGCERGWTIQLTLRNELAVPVTPVSGPALQRAHWRCYQLGVKQPERELFPRICVNVFFLLNSRLSLRGD